MVLIGITIACLRAIDECAGLPAHDAAKALRARVKGSPMAVARALVVAHYADTRVAVRRAAGALWRRYLPDAALGEATVVWATDPYGNPTLFAGFDLDSFGCPPSNGWVAPRTVDSVPARYGRVCSQCGEKPVSSREYAALHYGFRRRRYVDKAGEAVVYVAVQSACKQCRTTAKQTVDNERSYRVRSERVGHKPANDVISAVLGRAGL